MFDPNDLAGALIYHRDFIEQSETPQERGLTVYLVLRGVTGEEDLLSVFFEYWNAWSAGFVAQTDSWLVQQGLATNQREVAAAYARRDAYLADTHRWVTYYWQRGGRWSDDPDLAAVEREVHRSYTNDSAALKLFTFCVALNPNASDAEVVATVQAELDAASGGANDVPQMTNHPDPASNFANVIAEARRATRQGLIGGMLRSLDDGIARDNVAPEDVPSLRREVIMRLLGLNLPETPPTRSA